MVFFNVFPEAPLAWLVGSDLPVLAVTAVSCMGPLPSEPTLLLTLQPSHAVHLPRPCACLLSVSMLSSQLFYPRAWCVTGMSTADPEAGAPSQR